MNDSNYIFIDNVLRASIKDTINNNINSKLRIGNLSTISTTSFEIDDIAIWNRALSTSEILAIYNSSPLSANKAITKSQFNFNIFPNPASSELNVSLDIKKSTNLLITNELGQVVKNVILTQDNSKVDVSDLRKGIYFLFIENKSKKLIIN